MRAILAGHLHYSTSGTFAGVPVSVAAATCYTMNLARAAVDVNGMDAGQSFHLVHVYDDTITHAVVPVLQAPTADVFSAEWVERMSRLTPEQRLEAFSRKRPTDVAGHVAAAACTAGGRVLYAAYRPLRRAPRVVSNHPGTPL